MTLGCPGTSKRGREEKVTEFVIRGSSLEPLRGHSVSTERYILKFVFFREIHGRSVETELHFLLEMLVRGSTPGPPKDTPNR